VSTGGKENPKRLDILQPMYGSAEESIDMLSKWPGRLHESDICMYESQDPAKLSPTDFDVRTLLSWHGSVSCGRYTCHQLRLAFDWGFMTPRHRSDVVSTHEPHVYTEGKIRRGC
jgi:hypothetical protein